MTERNWADIRCTREFDLRKVVQLAKNAVGERGDFAEYAVVSLHCLRIYLEKSYREALDLLSEMPQILAEIGLDAADLPVTPR